MYIYINLVMVMKIEKNRVRGTAPLLASLTCFLATTDLLTSGKTTALGPPRAPEDTTTFWNRLCILYINHKYVIDISTSCFSHLSICRYMYTYTSSTAQGGGGSFKNRKPIGEVGCCESGMAKRIH